MKMARKRDLNDGQRQLLLLICAEDGCSLGNVPPVRLTRGQQSQNTPFFLFSRRLWTLKSTAKQAAAARVKQGQEKHI